MTVAWVDAVKPCYWVALFSVYFPIMASNYFYSPLTSAHQGFCERQQQKMCAISACSIFCGSAQIHKCNLSVVIHYDKKNIWQEKWKAFIHWRFCFEGTKRKKHFKPANFCELWLLRIYLLENPSSWLPEVVCSVICDDLDFIYNDSFPCWNNDYLQPWDFLQ